jgi:hypothetical protein
MLFPLDMNDFGSDRIHVRRNHPKRPGILSSGHHLKNGIVVIGSDRSAKYESRVCASSEPDSPAKNIGATTRHDIVVTCCHQRRRFGTSTPMSSGPNTKLMSCYNVDPTIPAGPVTSSSPTLDNGPLQHFDFLPRPHCFEYKASSKLYRPGNEVIVKSHNAHNVTPTPDMA